MSYWNLSDVEALRHGAHKGTYPLFHVTWASHLVSIQEQGLLVGGSHDQSNRWVGGAKTRIRCLGRIFLTAADRVGYWMEQMENNLDPPTDGDQLVVVAVNATALELTPDRAYRGDLTVDQPIPPTRLCGILQSDCTFDEAEAWAERQRTKPRHARPATTQRSRR